MDSYKFAGSQQRSAISALQEAFSGTPRFSFKPTAEGRRLEAPKGV
jgi:hypothetical protein